VVTPGPPERIPAPARRDRFVIRRRDHYKETPLSKLRVNAFSVSTDGFGAGSDEGRDQPLGRGGEQLHQWFLPTRTFSGTS